MKKLKHLPFLLLVLLLGACGNPATEEKTETTETADSTPRWVTVGGSVTETLAALGVESNIVATDVTSMYPEQMNSLPKVGYTSKLSAEAILSVNPTHLWGLENIGPPTALEQLETAGVEVKLFKHESTVEGAKALINELGAATNTTEKAQELIGSMEQELDGLNAKLASKTSTPKVLFIYARGQGVLNVAGENTAAGTMIELAGGENAVTGFEGFKPLTAEAVAAAQPEVILLPAGGLEALGGVEGLMEVPGVAATPAAKNERILTQDDLLLLGFGPRLGEAATSLAQALHPDLEWEME